MCRLAIDALKTSCIYFCLSRIIGCIVNFRSWGGEGLCKLHGSKMDFKRECLWYPFVAGKSNYLIPALRRAMCTLLRSGSRTRNSPRLTWCLESSVGQPGHYFFGPKWAQMRSGCKHYVGAALCGNALGWMCWFLEERLPGTVSLWKRYRFHFWSSWLQVWSAASRFSRLQVKMNLESMHLLACPLVAFNLTLLWCVSYVSCFMQRVRPFPGVGGLEMLHNNTPWESILHQ